MSIDLKQIFLQVKILHAAMFIGIVIFAVVSYVLHNVMEIGESLTVLPSNTIYLIILLATALLWIASIMYKNRASRIEGDLLLTERITRYRIAAILRVALTEAASFTVIIGYLLSGNLTYLLIAIIPLLYFAYTFPRDKEIIQALNLSYSEQQQLL